MIGIIILVAFIAVIFLLDPILNEPDVIIEPNKTYDASKLHDVAIGHYLLDKPDLDDYMEITQSTPPIVFFFVDWVMDEDLEAGLKAKEPVRLHRLDDEMIVFLNKLADQGTIPAFAWSVPATQWDVDSDEIHLVPNIPDVIKGKYDDYIADMARDLKAFDKPIMLTFLAEFNGYGERSFGKDGFGIYELGDVDDVVGQYGDPEWPDGPERVRDAFIHVIDVFNKEGADNVIWFMYGGGDHLTDEGESAWWSHPKYYYPGDEYIDWIGKTMGFESFTEFKDNFGPAYDAWGEVTQKPFFIPELMFNNQNHNNAVQMEQIFLDYLPTKPRFKAATIAHSPLGVEFGIKWALKLGGRKDQYPEEIRFWKQVIVKNPGYNKEFVLKESGR